MKDMINLIHILKILCRSEGENDKWKEWLFQIIRSYHPSL